MLCSDQLRAHVTWLEYFIIGAVCHVEPPQFNSHLVAAGLAHSEGHFHHVGLGFLKDLLGDGNVQSQLYVSDDHPQTHGPVSWKRLAVLIKELEGKDASLEYCKNTCT